MVDDHTFYLVSHCTNSGTIRYFQEIASKDQVWNYAWWWLQHRWYARPKATEFFQLLLPTLITLAAFMVAWSQREIAANKYRMDLYDKRAPAMEAAIKNEKKLIARKFTPLDDYGPLADAVDALIHLEKTFSLFSNIPLGIIGEELLYIKDKRDVLSLVQSEIAPKKKRNRNRKNV